MAKLYFYYSTMNAGKSTMLLQSSYNYRERGMNTLILSPELDTRFGTGKVASRIGIESDSVTFNASDNLFRVYQSVLTETEKTTPSGRIDCVLVDEAQFLTRSQARQLSDICDESDTPVLAYGLRTDFQGNLFEGSEALLAWADSLVELKTICHCGRKATMVLRIDASGRTIKDGSQIQIGGNDRYVSVCRRHFKAGMCEKRDDELTLLDS